MPPHLPLTRRPPFALVSRLATLAVLTAGAFTTGCATLGGETVYTAPDGARASLGDVLAALDEQQDALQTLQATRVRFILDTARSDATFAGRGDIYYQRPDAMHVLARHRTSGAIVLRMTVLGDEAAMEYGLGADRGEAIWRDGELVSGQSTPFTPWEVVREVFQPERWSALPRNSVRVSQPYDADTGEMMLAIGPRGLERRQVRVAGPPWRVVENRLLGPEGPIAKTTLLEHRQFNGVQVPTNIQAEFFEEPASLTLRLTRDPELNSPLDSHLFRLE